MDPTAMKGKLIAVLRQIQDDSDLKCPPLTGVTKPVEDLPEFDSKVWPVAITILATEIKRTIPNDMNIFVGKTTKLPYSIDETAVFLCDFFKRQSEQEAAAA